MHIKWTDIDKAKAFTGRTYHRHCKDSDKRALYKLPKETSPWLEKVRNPPSVCVAFKRHSPRDGTGCNYILGSLFLAQPLSSAFGSDRARIKVKNSTKKGLYTTKGTPDRRLSFVFFLVRVLFSAVLLS